MLNFYFQNYISFLGIFNNDVFQPPIISRGIFTGVLAIKQPHLCTRGKGKRRITGKEQLKLLLYIVVIVGTVCVYRRLFQV